MCPRNHQKGISWLKKAANGNNLWAQKRLAFDYLMQSDFKEVFYWKKRAAINGALDAQIDLSSCYSSGTGTPVSIAQAAHWLSIALANQEFTVECEQRKLVDKKRLRNLLKSMQTELKNKYQ